MEALLKVGIITQTHGIKGEVKVFPTTDDAARKFFKHYVILKFKGIDNINDVLAYKGSSLMVTRENAVKLNKDEYFIADLIGLHVSDDENKLEGKLVDVLETGANDVYVIALSDGRELLLPAIRECVLSVDLQAQEMKIHVLEGLLDEHKN